MKKIITAVTTTLFVGVIFYFFSFSTNRLPASTPPSPMIGKQNRLMDVRITSIGGMPSDENKDVVLRLSVQGFAPIETEVTYNWVLPPDVFLVSGELTDSVPNLLDSSKVFEREITVQGLTSEDASKVVVAQVYTEIDGIRLGNAGVFSPKPESMQTQKALFEKSSIKKSAPLPREVKL